jgi:TRAP-type uncharacterized transport system substrate-binding protein
MVSKSLSNDLAYKITKVMWENPKAISDAAPATRAFATANMYKDLSPIHYHPGATKFFKEVNAKQVK